MKLFLKSGLVILIGIIALAFILGGNKGNNNSASAKPTESVQTSEPTFDIPSLVGKNIDEVKTELSDYQGKTEEPTDQQIQMGVKDWDASFVKDGKELLVTYTIADRKVKEFFIGTDDPSGKTKDLQHFLNLGNLSESDSSYSLRFIPAIKDSTSFTGVRVEPN